MANTDDLPRLEYGGEMVRPARDNYNYNPPWGATKSDIAGTLSRLGRSAFGGPADVSCTVQLHSPAMLQWWDDFYNLEIAEGTKRFVMELFVNGFIQEHVVQIVSRPAAVTVGWKGSIDLQLQAVPIIDRCAMASRLLITKCQGDHSSCYINDLIELGLSLNNAWTPE
ncbi:hypothetical protein e2701_00053 [Klebsiella phage e270.1]|uniref:hypothetical protein n=1 Tax=Klebsiella pneumoniae TaxID=573 RepID=UPI000F7DF8CE|nr:hypothetical protein [Klebsiella pneumoniae]WDQ26664.1 hypothetical protein phiKPNH21_00052 [Klebsiella phage phi_KPN_H2]WMT10404.1 hypothetical protein phi270_00009 [Klebsiella phage phi_270]WMT10612.1 hypothetical protein e2701_00053 [Klebsiella phage e270.1]WMT10698.1 hypothetical protein e2702_00052 [Klebsiella phage e270.2]RTA29640.1 hypothetical protein EJ496_28090 [Klebsiella pneumoniae subsp. pneumoniae]